MKLSWLPATLILGLLAVWSPGQDAKSDVIAEFDVARDGDAVVLPGTVNGKTVMFLLNTGSALNALDKTRLSARVMDTTKLLTPTGELLSRNMYKLPDTRVAGQVLQESDRILGVDLKDLRDSCGHDICGFLGMEFLRRHIVRVDFDRGKVVFLKEVPTNSGTPMCLSFDDIGMPYVTARVGQSLEAAFMVNTGLLSRVSGNMRQDAFRRGETNGTLKVVDRLSAMSMAGPVRHRMGQVRHFTVGPFDVAKPVFGESIANMLGLGYLSRFQVTFDFPNGLMYLKKGRRFDEPDRSDRSGLHLIRVAGKTIVHGVDKNSPAATSRLQADDVILHINGKAVQDASMFQLRNMLIRSEKEVRVAVQRGDQRIEATLVLEPPPVGGK